MQDFLTRWQLRGIEKTDLDPLRFRSTARLFNLLGLAVVGGGAVLVLLGAFPLGPLLLGVGALVFLLPKLLVSVRAGSIREMLGTEMVFFTALVQMAFATKAHLNLLIERMTRYRELPGVRTLALAAWNNAKMIGMTDSGAYQILRYGTVDVDPDEILLYQHKIGSDIGVILDLPFDYEEPYHSALLKVEETLRRARRATRLLKDLDMVYSVREISLGRGYAVKVRESAKGLKEPLQ